MRHFPLCYRDGRQRKWAVVMSLSRPDWPLNVTRRKTITEGGGGGSATLISNGTGHQDTGGGEMQLTSFRDESVVWPMLQPTLQSVGLQSSEVRVSTLSVDATRRRVDGTVSTVSDGVEIDDSDMTQWDSQTQLGSGLPLPGGGGEVRSVWIVPEWYQVVPMGGS